MKEVQILLIGRLEYNMLKCCLFSAALAYYSFQPAHNFIEVGVRAKNHSDYYKGQFFKLSCCSLKDARKDKRDTDVVCSDLDVHASSVFVGILSLTGLNN